MQKRHTGAFQPVCRSLCSRFVNIGSVNILGAVLVLSDIGQETEEPGVHSEIHVVVVHILNVGVDLFQSVRREGIGVLAVNADKRAPHELLDHIKVTRINISASAVRCDRIRTRDAVQDTELMPVSDLPAVTAGSGRSYTYLHQHHLRYKV